MLERTCDNRGQVNRLIASLYKICISWPRIAYNLRSENVELASAWHTNCLAKFDVLWVASFAWKTLPSIDLGVESMRSLPRYCLTRSSASDSCLSGFGLLVLLGMDIVSDGSTLAGITSLGLLLQDEHNVLTRARKVCHEVKFCKLSTGCHTGYEEPLSMCHA